MIAINQVGLGSLQFLTGDMATIGKRNLMFGDDPAHMLGKLSGPHVGTIGEGSDDVALRWIAQLRIRTRNGSKMPCPVIFLVGIPKNIQDRAIWHKLPHRLLQSAEAG